MLLVQPALLLLQHARHARQQQDALVATSTREQEITVISWQRRGLIAPPRLHAHACTPRTHAPDQPGGLPLPAPRPHQRTQRSPGFRRPSHLSRSLPGPPSPSAKRRVAAACASGAIRHRQRPEPQRGKKRTGRCVSRCRRAGTRAKGTTDVCVFICASSRRACLHAAAEYLHAHNKGKQRGPSLRGRPAASPCLRSLSSLFRVVPKKKLNVFQFSFFPAFFCSRGPPHTSLAIN